MAQNHGVKFFVLGKNDGKQDIETIKDIKDYLLQAAKEWQAKMSEPKESEK